MAKDPIGGNLPMDTYTVMLNVMTDSGAVFTVGITGAKGVDENDAQEFARQVCLTHGCKVLIIQGAPPVPVKPVAAVAIHCMKTSLVSIVGGG